MLEINSVLDRRIIISSTPGTLLWIAAATLFVFGLGMGIGVARVLLWYTDGMARDKVETSALIKEMRVSNAEASALVTDINNGLFGGEK